MCLPCASSTVGMASVLKLLTVAAVAQAAVASDYSTSPRSTPNAASHSSADVSPSVAFLTVNRCEEHPVPQLKFVERSTIPLDCRCPAGFAAVRAYDKSNKALCVGIRTAGPWQDGCIQSGTATDYYDLDADELGKVRELLLRLNVSECWISARRLLKYGELVRRLPGTRWNAPIELPKAPAPGYYSKEHDCASVRIDQQSIQLTYQNCSAFLPQLCIYREGSLLQLHCDANEFTTRYASHQRYCFSIRKNSLHTLRILRLAMKANESFLIDSNRKGQLLIEMYDASKDCSDSSNVIYADQKERTHHAHRRDVGDFNQMPNRDTADFRDLIPIVSSDPRNFACIAQQRVHIASDSLVTVDGTGPGMYLYFDKARHKLFLTVYGDRWFWREDTSAQGFVCFTNTDGEQLQHLRVKKLRASHVSWQELARNASDLAANRLMYEVKLEEYGPPRPYWCEAHLVPDFALIKTDTVLAQRKPNCRRYFSATIELMLERSSTKTPPDTLRLKYYDERIEEHIKNQRKRFPTLKHIFAAIKSIHVKRVENFWTSASNDWYTVRLLLHIVTKCAKKWDKAELLEAERNEIELPTKYLDYYQMHLCLKTALKSLNGDGFRFLATNSTEYCLPESLKLSTGKNVWWPARLGETVAPRNLCLIEYSGLPITRRCIGDYLYGCAWDWNPGSDLCSNAKRPTTNLLYRYSVSQLNQSVLADVLNKAGDVLATPADVIPADLFYISKTLENVPTLFGRDVRDEPSRHYFCNISNILSRVMYLNETTVVLSQRALNTTNILLDATETIVNRLALANDTQSLMQGEQYDCQTPGLAGQQRRPNDGTVLFRTARLIVLIADPAVANVTGLALFRSRKSHAAIDSLSDDVEADDQEDFRDYRLRYLYMNQTIESLLAESDLEIGSFIPQHVIEGLDELNDAITTAEEEEDPDTAEASTTPAGDVPTQDPVPSPPTPLRIIITIYYNDHAFRETNNGTVARPNAKIISVSLPGYGSRMPGEIPIYTREHVPDRPGRCGYWSFDADNLTEEFGHWSYDECRLLNTTDTLSLCGCFHLTSFSRLTKDIQVVETVGVSQKFIADKGTLALDIITAIGCSLSLLGVVGIFATALLFPSWRAKASSKILLQLSCAIAIEMIIIFLEGPDIDQHRIRQIECALLGAIFHYIILVTFMWMLITAYLQFMRYVKVLGRLRPAHFILKATVCCWGGPLLLVAVFLSLDYTLYLKRDNLSDICYPHGAALWYGLLLPIGLIIFVNFISFVIVMYHIFTIPNNLTKTADHAMTVAQLRLSVFLFFLLGLPWIFGMLTTGTEDKLFAYLFCITAPVQGFVLFVYFVIMDPAARRFWYRKWQRLPCVARAEKQIDGEQTTSPNTSFNTYL